MSSKTPDSRIGQTVADRFRLDSLLGVGGMGKVYLATQLSVERRVAIKVLHDEVVGDPQARGRFLREAQTVASIAHPGIVQLVDFGEDDELEVLFLAMEFVEGVPLSSVMKMGALRPEVAVDIARQISGALAQAHRAGIVHRDLKPDNVMLVVTADRVLQAKILDFGIALPNSDETRLTSTGAIVGTPHYMSPEQAQDQPVGPATDIYALGVILYEMLTGSLPFVADTPLALLFKHVQQEAPVLSEVKPDIPPILDDVVAEMLAKAPTDRPSDASELAARLAAMSDRLGKFDSAELEIGSTRPEALLPLVDVRRATTEATDVFGATAVSDELSSVPGDGADSAKLPSIPDADGAGGLYETTETAEDLSEPEARASTDVGADERRWGTVAGNRVIIAIAVVLVAGIGVAAWLLSQRLGEEMPPPADPPPTSRVNEFAENSVNELAETIARQTGRRVGERAEELVAVVPAAGGPAVKADDESGAGKEETKRDDSSKRVGSVDGADSVASDSKSAPKVEDPHDLGPRIDEVEIPNTKKVKKKAAVTPPTIPPPTDEDTLARRNRALGGFCMKDNKCQFDGVGKPGSAICRDQSTCVARCPIGGCIQFCEDEATCYFSCSGGGCQRMKGPNATIHEFED